MRLVTALAFIATVWAQPALDTPRAGMMLDREGSLRPVHGIAGSFTTAAPAATGVRAAACADTCLIKTEDAVVWGDRAADAPPGDALIALDGETAWLYFPASRSFARWDGAALSPLDWRIPVWSDGGEVLALSSPAAIAVRRDDVTWIVDKQGGVHDALAVSSGPVLLMDRDIVYVTGSELILRRADRSEQRFPLSRIQRVSQLGTEFVQVTTAEGIYALRTTPGREQLFHLPEPAAQRSRRRP